MKEEGQRLEGAVPRRLCKQALDANTSTLTTESQVNRGQVAVQNLQIHQRYGISQTRFLTNVSSRYKGLGGKKKVI